MRTVVTRLVVTTLVAICVFAPTPARAQEQVASKPRIDFRFKAGQPTSFPSPLLTAARPAAVNTPAVPRRKMPTGVRIAIGAAIGLAAGFAYLGASRCGDLYVSLSGEVDNSDYNQCTWSFVGIIAGGGVIGYFAGR